MYPEPLRVRCRRERCRPDERGFVRGETRLQAREITCIKLQVNCATDESEAVKRGQELLGGGRRGKEEDGNRGLGQRRDCRCS